MDSINELVVISNENYREWKRLAEMEKETEEMKRLFNKSIFWLETYSVALFLLTLEKLKNELPKEKRKDIERIVKIGKARIAKRLVNYASKSAVELEKLLDSFK